MKFYINVKIYVIGSGDATSGYSIAIDVLHHSVEELQTTGEARGREEFQGRDEAQRREEYRTREHSPSKERYEAREQVRATAETRSTEEYRARGVKTRPKCLSTNGVDTDDVDTIQTPNCGVIVTQNNHETIILIIVTT
jgi:hypothetical protein